MNLLIVDDDTDWLDTLGGMFKRKGATVTSYDSAESALKALSDGGIHR